MALRLSLAAAAGWSHRGGLQGTRQALAPILNAFDEVGVDVCYEIHPGEDVFDGATFEMFLDALKGHKRCNINYDPSHFVLQQLDYLAFIDIYHERIKAFHVKDAEFNPMAGRASIPATRAG
jgi:sugar phosphate isomerase/epimerase